MAIINTGKTTPTQTQKRQDEAKQRAAMEAEAKAKAQAAEQAKRQAEAKQRAELEKQAAAKKAAEAAAKTKAAKEAEIKAEAAEAKAIADAKARAAANATKTANTKTPTTKTTNNSNKATTTKTTTSVKDTKSVTDDNKSNSLYGYAKDLAQKSIKDSGISIGDNVLIGGNGGGVSAALNRLGNGVDASLGDVMNAFSGLTDQILGAASDMYPYEKVQLMEAVTPVLQTADSLAKKFGLDYNFDNIYNTLIGGVDAGYKVRYTEQANTEDKYYDNAATAQSTLASTLQQQQSQAIMNGMNRGMQAANALSSILGVSQQFSANATQLAQDRVKLGQEYGAAKAKTKSDALTAYNMMGQQLADVAKNLYSADSSSYAAQLSYNADANTANATMAANQMAAQAQVQSALTNSLSSVWNSYYNGQISLEQANIQANAAVESAKVYGIDAANINAAANQAIAQTNAAAQLQSAQIGAAGNENAARITAKGYLQNASLADAQANKQAQSNAVTGLMASLADGIYNNSQAQMILEGYKAGGTIDNSTYNALNKILNPASSQATFQRVPNTTNNNAALTPVPGALGSELAKKLAGNPISPNAGGGYKY